VVWQPATGAAVLELRAADSPGLLYRVADALAKAGARVRAARISTLGGAAVDAFYLVGAWDDAAARATVEAAVLGAVAPTAG
jgi:[protein-PII] uridylyltransferase